MGSVLVCQKVVVVEEEDLKNLLQGKQDLTVAAKALKIEVGRL